MKVFKIMGLYLLAAVTLMACSKDNQEAIEIEQKNDANFGVSRAVSFDYDYYTISQLLQEDAESHGAPSFPLNSEDLAYYTDLTGIAVELDLETVNLIAEQTLVSKEMGIKKYMDEKMELKDFTKNTAMKIIENGAFKDLTRLPEFYEIPDREQNMLMAANAAAKNFEGKLRAARHGSDVIMEVMIGTIAGTLTGAYYGTLCCGLVGGAIGGFIGGVVGGFVAWLGSGK